MLPLNRKVFRLLTLGVLTWAATAAQGAPSLSVGSASGSAGSAVDTIVQFNPGGSSISSLQFNLTLPVVVTTVSVTAGPLMVSASKTVGAQLNGSVWTLVVFGINQATLGTGNLLTVRTQIASGTPAGTFPVPISGTVYAAPNGLSIPGGSSSDGSLTVTPVSQPTTVMPTFTPTGGTFTSNVQVSMQSLTPGAFIYYTLDGSNPTISSTLYSAPITLTQTTTLKAFALANGMNPSAVASTQFTNTSVSPATLPLPNLSGIPTFIALTSQLDVIYDPLLDVSFLWTFTPQVSAGSTSPLQGGRSLSGQAATFKTTAKTARLSSYGLTAGTYLVTVQAVDNTNASRL